MTIFEFLPRCHSFCMVGKPAEPQKRAFFTTPMTTLDNFFFVPRHARNSFVVPCCLLLSVLSFLLFFPSPARNIFVQIRAIRGKKNSVPSSARNHSGVDIVRSRIAVSATLPVPYRVLRLASAMTRRVYCWFFVSLTNSRNVICPLARRSLKTLRALNLGKNKRAVFYDNPDNL